MTDARPAPTAPTNTTAYKICTLAVMILILWCTVWETVGAPIRALHEGGSWLAFKGILLVPLIHRLWRGERRAYQILSLLILLYVTEGCVRAYSDISFAGRAYAWGEIALSVIIFILTIKIAHALRIIPKNAEIRAHKPRPKSWAQLSMYLYASLLIFTGMSFFYTPDGT